MEFCINVAADVDAFLAALPKLNEIRNGVLVKKEHGIMVLWKGVIKVDKGNWERKKNSFKNVLDRLGESLKLPSDQSIIIDGVIQRFEFTYELAWKWMKQFLEFKGIFEAKTPRDVIKHSFVAGIILDGDAFIEMMKDRNTSAHTYDEAMAIALYYRIKNVHFPLLNALYERLHEEVIEA